MLTEIKPYLDWLQLHPHLGGLIAFVTTFLECTVVIGLILPSVVLMVALGTLIGIGVLPSNIIIWAIIGGIVGDVLSYWLGRHFHGHIREFWPFRSYPQLLQKGVEFFHRHGGKSVFLGRFLGPIRSVAPLIAGTMSMSFARFIVSDIISSVLWVMLYMAPGILLGAASQQLPPETATKLILYVVVILLFFWIVSWLIQRIYLWFIRLLDRQVAWLWKFTRNHPRMKIIKQILTDPGNPHSHDQLATALLFIISTLAFFVLAYSVAHHGALTNWNEIVYHVMRSLRTTTFDKIFAAITLLSPAVFTATWLAVLGRLLYKRNFWAAAHWFAIGVLSSVGALVLKHLIHSPRPTGIMNPPAGWSFPSGHSVMSVAILGSLAVVISHNRNKIWKWCTYGTAATVAGAIMLSRLYLEAHWFTDVIGGALFAISCITLVALSYRRKIIKPFSPWPIIIVTVLALSISWGISLYRGFQKTLQDSIPYWPAQTIDTKAWWSSKIKREAIYRVNRFNKPIEILNIQWAGDLFNIQNNLQKQGWRLLPKTQWLMALYSLTTEDQAQQLPILSHLYEDRKPVLIMIKYIPNINSLAVLRLWDAHLKLDNGTPLWLGTVSYHKGWHLQFKRNHNKITKLPVPTSILLQDLNSFEVERITYSIASERSTNTEVLLIRAKK